MTLERSIIVRLCATPSTTLSTVTNATSSGSPVAWMPRVGTPRTLRPRIRQCDTIDPSRDSIFSSVTSGRASARRRSLRMSGVRRIDAPPSSHGGSVSRTTVEQGAEAPREKRKGRDR